ncbi:MAG: hypothetical protein N3E46_04405 [Gemmataceae bacterium]|nr:hypothetical protein [Gemmataceae bacterium]
MTARHRPPPNLPPDAVIRDWLPFRRLLETVAAETAPTASPDLLTASSLLAEGTPRRSPAATSRPAASASPAARPASRHFPNDADSDEATQTWEDGHFSTENNENPQQTWDDGYDEDDDGCGTDHSCRENMTCHCHCHCAGHCHCHDHCPCSADDPACWEYGGDDADACHGWCGHHAGEDGAGCCCCHGGDHGCDAADGGPCCGGHPCDMDDNCQTDGDDGEDCCCCHGGGCEEAECHRCHSEHLCDIDENCQTGWDDEDETEGCVRRSPFRSHRREAGRSPRRQRWKRSARRRLARTLRLAIMVKLLSLLRQKLRRRKRRRSSRSPAALARKRHEAQLRWLAHVSAFLRRLARRQELTASQEGSADGNMSSPPPSRSEVDHSPAEPPPSESAAGTIPLSNQASPDGVSQSDDSFCECFNSTLGLKNHSQELDSLSFNFWPDELLPWQGQLSGVVGRVGEERGSVRSGVRPRPSPGDGNGGGSSGSGGGDGDGDGGDGDDGDGDGGGGDGDGDGISGKVPSAEESPETNDATLSVFSMAATAGEEAGATREGTAKADAASECAAVGSDFLPSEAAGDGMGDDGVTSDRHCEEAAMAACPTLPAVLGKTTDESPIEGSEVLSAVYSLECFDLSNYLPKVHFSHSPGNFELDNRAWMAGHGGARGPPPGGKDSM